jgi:glyoxylase-like metal-dependent hydrolase (beta-lactamase superfamily II)
MFDSVVKHDSQSAPTRYVAPELSYLHDHIVNVCFVGTRGAGDREWVLVDAGLPGSAGKIKRAAAELYGEGSRPAAIVLTHGHLDHVGAIHTLSSQWDVPVYAHELELPYLTGRSAYPPPDPLVGGGTISLLSILFPTGPIDLRGRVQALPADGSVPGMSGWRWLFTPGHTAGHVSFVRDSDRAMIAGDAFCTTKPESLAAALTQRPEIHGPPMYFTPDWGNARTSVQLLANYMPSVVVAGHGPPMRGERLTRELRRLALHFAEWARPAHGRYRDRPAIMDASGVVDVPPPLVSGRTVAITGLAVGAAVGLAVVLRRRERSRHLADVGAGADALGTELATADGGYDVTDPS